MTTKSLFNSKASCGNSVLLKTLTKHVHMSTGMEVKEQQSISWEKRNKINSNDKKKLSL